MTPHLEALVFKDEKAGYVVAIADDNYISLECVKFGNYVSSHIQQVLRLYEELGFAQGKTFLDIGANIGTETILALRSGVFARAICIEPMIDNARNLNMALAANDLAAKAMVIRSAVSNKAGTLKMKRSRVNAGDHRIAEGVDHGDDLLDVAVMTVDQALDVAEQRADDIGLMFIDIQGFETEAIEGADSLIAARVPIVLESTPKAMREHDRVKRLLAKLGGEYSRYQVLGSDGFLEVHRLSKLTSLASSELEHIDLFVH